MRRRFQESPRRTLQELTEMGLELSEVERAALAVLDPAAIQAFARALDPHLQKVDLAAEADDEVRA